MPIGPTPADEPTRRLERDRPAAGNAPQGASVGASIGASTPEKDPAGETSLLGDAENAEKTSLLDGSGAPAAGTTTLLDGGETPTTGATTLLDGAHPGLAYAEDPYEPDLPIDETVQFGEGEVRTVGPSVYPDAYADSTVAPVGVDDGEPAGYGAPGYGPAGYESDGYPAGYGPSPAFDADAAEGSFAGAPSPGMSPSGAAFGAPPVDRTVAMPGHLAGPNTAYRPGREAWGEAGTGYGRDRREGPAYNPAILRAAAEQEEARSRQASQERDRGGRLLRRGAIALVVAAVLLVAASVAWEAAQGALKGFGDRIGEVASSLFDRATESIQGAGEQLGSDAADAVGDAVSSGLGDLVQGALGGTGTDTGGDAGTEGDQSSPDTSQPAGESGASGSGQAADGTTAAGGGSAAGGAEGDETAGSGTTTTTPSTEAPADPTYDDVAGEGSDAGSGATDPAGTGQAPDGAADPSADPSADAGGQQPSDQEGASVTVTPPADGAA